MAIFLIEKNNGSFNVIERLDDGTFQYSVKQYSDYLANYDVINTWRIQFGINDVVAERCKDLIEKTLKFLAEKSLRITDALLNGYGKYFSYLALGTDFYVEDYPLIACTPVFTSDGGDFRIYKAVFGTDGIVSSILNPSAHPSFKDLDGSRVKLAPWGTRFLITTHELGFNAYRLQTITDFNTLKVQRQYKPELFEGMTDDWGAIFIPLYILESEYFNKLIPKNYHGNVFSDSYCSDVIENGFGITVNELHITIGQDGYLSDRIKELMKGLVSDCLEKAYNELTFGKIYDGELLTLVIKLLSCNLSIELIDAEDRIDCCNRDSFKKQLKVSDISAHLDGQTDELIEPDFRHDGIGNSVITYFMHEYQYNYETLLHVIADMLLEPQAVFRYMEFYDAISCILDSNMYRIDTANGVQSVNFFSAIRKLLPYASKTKAMCKLYSPSQNLSFSLLESDEYVPVRLKQFELGNSASNSDVVLSTVLALINLRNSKNWEPVLESYQSWEIAREMVLSEGNADYLDSIADKSANILNVGTIPRELHDGDIDLFRVLASSIVCFDFSVDDAEENGVTYKRFELNYAVALTAILPFAEDVLSYLREHTYIMKLLGVWLFSKVYVTQPWLWGISSALDFKTRINDQGQGRIYMRLEENDDVRFV